MNHSFAALAPADDRSRCSADHFAGCDFWRACCRRCRIFGRAFARFRFRGAARRVVRILGRTRDDVRLRGAVMAAAAAMKMKRRRRGFMVRSASKEC